MNLDKYTDDFMQGTEPSELPNMDRQPHPPSKTPRTDAVWRKSEPLPWEESFKAMHDHADLLEKELSEAKDYVDEVRSSDLIRQEIEANLRHDFTRLRSVAAQMAEALEWSVIQGTHLNRQTEEAKIYSSALTAYQALGKEKTTP